MLCNFNEKIIGFVAWKSAILELKIYAAYILYNFEVYSDEDNEIELDINTAPNLGIKLRRRH